MPRLLKITQFLKLSINQLSTSPVILKDQLKNAKKFKTSSQQWLLRQINDKYVKQAKFEHYRCRSAFKLLEIDKSYKLFKPGQIVVDLGCAPGSWTQVAVKATKADEPGSKSVVLGVDLAPVHPIEGATLLGSMDFTAPETQQRLMQVLDSRKVNVIVSDMAPSATGIKFMDHTKIVKLCYAVLEFAKVNSSLGGSLVMKVFEGNESQTLKKDALQLYEHVRIKRPDASRQNSTEMFFVCLNFKGNRHEESSINS